MSWVALLKATNQKKANVSCTAYGASMVKATPAKPTPAKNCMTTIHQRFFLNKSTRGLQMGLMTQGR